MRRLEENRLLWPSLRAYGRTLPVIVLLGITSSMAEALGIGLFLPLLEPNYLYAGAATIHGGRIAHALAAVTSMFPHVGRTGVIVGIILAALAMKAVISYTNGLVSAHKNLQIGHELRTRLFEQLLNTGYTFVSRNEWGKLLETLSTETWRTTEALSAAISLIINACTVMVFVGLLLFLSWRLTLAIAVCMLLFSMGLRWIRRPVARHGETAVDLNGRLGELMVDGILGVRTIEAFNLQAFMGDQFEKASDRVRAAFLRVETWSGMVNPCAEISSSLLLLGLLLLAMKLGAPWPIVIVTVMMIYRLQMPFKQLETARVNWSALHGAAANVFSLLERTAPSESPRWSHQEPRSFERLENPIRFHHVSFVYPESERPALSDVTVEIPRGKVTALVGLSGAGKTTFLNLVCGLQEPSSGDVLVNGSSLASIDRRTWRSRIALAGQDVHLFNTTVRENIRYGRLEASLQEIAEAARKAHIDAFIESLPHGYDTPLGDNGGRISGGQRQRIALARAFLRNPEVLVLDEATNALDSFSEQWIQSMLENFQDRCTVLVAAHRFSTIQNADHVIVLEDGRVIETGNPVALRMQNGLFARLCELQSLAFVNEA